MSHSIIASPLQQCANTFCLSSHFMSFSAISAPLGLINSAGCSMQFLPLKLLSNYIHALMATSDCFTRVLQRSYSRRADIATSISFLPPPSTCLFWLLDSGGAEELISLIKPKGFWMFTSQNITLLWKQPCRAVLASSVCTFTVFDGWILCSE